ncbi:hypothetical protein KCU64_g7634, partial [Aureobasidium melanogenum]
MMDGADNMPQTEGSTTDSLGSSVTTSEVAAQETGQSRFVQSLKNYQSKSPEEIAVILKQWQEIEEECAKNIVDVEQLIPKVDRIRLSMFSHLAYYALRIKNLSSTKDLDQLSSEQLQSFHQALDHGQKVGEATWELYNMQKKMSASENALEKYIAFREDNSSNPGIEFVAPEPELSTAQMVQAVKDQYEELSRIGNDTIPLLEAWQHAVYRLATLKQCLEARHPGEPNAKNMDPDNVARLTHVVQADKMIDELEDLTVKLKVKAWADGDSGAHDLVQDTEDRLMRCRGVISKVAEQIVKQREEIMDGR